MRFSDKSVNIFFCNTFRKEAEYYIIMRKPDSRKQRIQDKRKHNRLFDVQKIRYRILKPGEGDAFVQNLSESGCCLLLNEELPIGSILELDFEELGDRKKNKVKILGKVIWQNEYLAGIKFLRKK